MNEEQEGLLINAPTENTKKTTLKSWLKNDLAFLLYGLGSILGGASQQISLPLFISTFGGSTGVYFIVFICSLAFNFVFWPLVLYRYVKGKIDLSASLMTNVNNQKKN